MFTAFIDFPFPANCRFRTPLKLTQHYMQKAEQWNNSLKRNGKREIIENFNEGGKCNFIKTSPR